MGWGAVIGAVAGQVIPSLIGANQGKKGTEAAGHRLNEAIAQYQNIEIPTIEDQELLLREFEVAGVLTPELEQAVRQGDTNFSGIVEDPRLREAQMNALLELQQISDEGGLRLEDKQKLDQIQGKAARDATARNEAVMQKMNQRGFPSHDQCL